MFFYLNPYVHILILKAPKSISKYGIVGKRLLVVVRQINYDAY